MLKEEFVEKSVLRHGLKYCYDKVPDSFYGKEKVDIICPIHGLFSQASSKHIFGRGCPKCAIEYRSKLKTKTTERFIEEAKIIHGDLYDYSNSVYNGTYGKIEIICKKHGSFFQRANDHLNGHGCPHCGNNKSLGENEIIDYIKSLNASVNAGNRSILNGNELDIYLPSFSIGIEYNGLFWHSDAFKENDYHLKKTRLCEDKNIKLMHIFEDEWLYKQEIVKSIISSLLNKNDNVVFVNDCTVIDNIDNDLKSKFLNDNHIEGDTDDEYSIGLSYNNELILLISFNKDFVIHRLCAKLFYTVVDGYKTVIEYIKKKYNIDNVSYIHNRRFILTEEENKIISTIICYSNPNFFYSIGNNKYRVRKLMIEDGNELKHNKIYDCGNIIYKLK